MNVWIGLIWLRNGTFVVVYDWDCLVARLKKRSALSSPHPPAVPRCTRVHARAHTPPSLSPYVLLESHAQYQTLKSGIVFQFLFPSVYRTLVIPVGTMKHVECVEVQLQKFLTSMLGGGQPTFRLRPFFLFTSWTSGCTGHRQGLYVLRNRD